MDPGSSQCCQALGPEAAIGPDAQEVPPEHGQELSCAVTKHWNRFPREGVEPPSLKIFQNCLDTSLSYVLRDDPA